MASTTRFLTPRVARVTRRVVGIVGALVLASAAVPARADDGDGLYGRFAGDLSLAIVGGGGATVTAGADPRGAVVGSLHARFVDAAGPFVAARWVAGGGANLVAGVELRPLFLALFLRNLWTGSELFDRTVQSIALELGAAYGPLDEDPGFALALGLSLEVPITSSDDGTRDLSLRLGSRHVRARAEDRAGPDDGFADWTLYAALVLTGRVDTGLASWDPPRYDPDL